MSGAEAKHQRNTKKVVFCITRYLVFVNNLLRWQIDCRSYIVLALKGALGRGAHARLALQLKRVTHVIQGSHAARRTEFMLIVIIIRRIIITVFKVMERETGSVLEDL